MKDEREIRLELLKLVWPDVIQPDPAEAIRKAETLLTFVNAAPAPKRRGRPPKADKSTDPATD